MKPMPFLSCLLRMELRGKGSVFGTVYGEESLNSSSYRTSKRGFVILLWTFPLDESWIEVVRHCMFPCFCGYDSHVVFDTGTAAVVRCGGLSVF